MINDLKNQTLLVVSPHPDDEALGCGGLIKRVKDAGGKVYILFMTTGMTLDYSPKGISTVDERFDEIKQVANFLNYDGYRIAFPGNDYHLKLDKVPQKDIINEIENGNKISLSAIKPTIVAAPIYPDYNQDHITCTQALFAATRPTPDNIKPMQPVILGYESVPTANWWNTTKNNMNFFVSLSTEQLETKIEALSLYKSQIRPYPHSRSLQAMRNLAQYRGMLAGIPAAEAFFVYRNIIL
jgi:LmbE family N-acetylglucosaminyl deacetylase